MELNLKKAYYTILVIFLLLFLKSDDKEFYKDIKDIENPDSYLVLVNKNNKLDKNYVPKDLELLSLNNSYEYKYLRKQAKEAFENLSNDAKALGYRIIAVSAYRDYDYQEKLFNYYVNEKGLEYALRSSAKSGHSEHQTGLALDVEGSNKDYNKFEESIEADWMKKNAYKYGFILRYPKGSENITGFKYEPWHYRYVGIKEAKYIYENNITLEEYLEINF
jgi:D-alanyl-D-alanine carboxypeptidase